MNLDQSYNICEDWGWFIDIETSEKIPNIIKFQTEKKKIQFHNNLSIIYEDEYDFYTKNQRDLEIIKIEDKKIIPKGEESSVYNIMSTTLATVLLTYFIYFRL